MDVYAPSKFAVDPSLNVLVARNSQGLGAVEQSAQRPRMAKCVGSMENPSLSRAVRASPLNMSGGASIIWPQLAQMKCACACEARTIARRAVAEVRVRDDPELLQLLEIPVDRREMHVRCPLLDGLSQRFCAHVAFGAEQHLQQDPSRGGDPAASSAQVANDAIYRREVHIVKLVLERFHAPRIAIRGRRRGALLHTPSYLPYLVSNADPRRPPP